MNKNLKIVVTDFIESDLNWEIEELAADPVDFIPKQLKHVPQEELIEAISDADVLIVNMARMSREVLARLNNCKLIIRHGAGYDNIDVASAQEFGIAVAYVPDYCSEEVAEQAQLLLLTAWRKFSTQLEVMQTSVVNGQWRFDPVKPLKRMAGSKVGLIGCGRIGSISLRMLRGLGFEVLVCDPYLSAERKEELGITTLPLNDILPQVDVVTLHCALTEETRHLISHKDFELMKESSIIINTARGAVVDTDALASAIGKSSIGGAGIDVYEQEPPSTDFPLIGLDNVILTPHLSWYSEDAEWSIRTKIMQDIRLFLEGLPPRFPVNDAAKRINSGDVL
jgi:D-3-phosphoglycerate dehydrogenase / 2-oxoglutarate reductase